MPKKTSLVVPESTETRRATISLPDPATISPPMMDMRKMIDTAVSEQDWIVIFGKMSELAKTGDKKAAEFLAKYRFGVPAPMGAVSEKTGTGVIVLEITKTTLSREDHEREIVEGVVEEKVDAG